jgi:hypothetical protein
MSNNEDFELRRRVLDQRGFSLRRAQVVAGAPPAQVFFDLIDRAPRM